MCKKNFLKFGQKIDMKNYWYQELNNYFVYLRVHVYNNNK